MEPDVTRVDYLGGHRLRLHFEDGVVGEVDLREHIFGKGGVYKALEDPVFFSRASVNEAIGTIVWPNDADFSPEFLYRLVTTNRPIVHR
jgi:hypothetical protein